MEGEDYIAKLKKIEAAEGRHVFITNHWLTRGDKMQYQSLVLFLAPRFDPGTSRAGGIHL